MYRFIITSSLLVSVSVVLTFANILSLYSANAVRNADTIVVFGAAVWPGDFGPVPSHALSDRARAGATLYKENFADTVILSGADSVYGAHEVDIMTDIMVREGVPLEAIILDREGVNTSATIAKLEKGASYILVSNDFHLARIGLLAHRAGLAEAGAPPAGFQLHAAAYTTGGRYIREPYFVFREAVAWWYYFFATIL